VGDGGGEGVALYATGDNASKSAWAITVASICREVRPRGDARCPPRGVPVQDACRAGTPVNQITSC
jgi:hypothetical protein